MDAVLTIGFCCLLAAVITSGIFDYPRGRK